MKRFLSLPIDWLTLFIPLLLTATGIITIYTITFSQHQATLAVSQLVYAVFGVIVMLLLMFSDYRFWGQIGGWLFVGGLLLLLPLLPPFAPHFPFVLKVFGAHRWLDFGLFQLQPAEIFKLIAAIFGAKYLAEKIGLLGWRQIVVYLTLSLGAFALVLAQPDLGTAAVILIVCLSLFLAARPPRRAIFVMILAAIIAVPLLWANLQEYQKNRIETFLNPSSDPQGQGYNVRQSLIAIGSGGLFGRGFGQGSQTVLNFLPVPHADFIFAGYAEASGFIGSFILVCLYIVLIQRAILIGRDAQESFGQLLAIAIAAKFTFQAVVHMAMNLGLLPVTGIPLPFMSYGGTALITDLASIGLLESIYIRNKRAFFK